VTRFERIDSTMPIAFAYTLIVLLIITSILLTLLILAG
jgi:preprotein translocase subunit SecG